MSNGLFVERLCGGTQVDVAGRRLVLSESATLMADLAAQLQEGDTVEGVVTSLRDYGAFVSIRSPDGELHGTQVTHPPFWLQIHCLLFFPQDDKVPEGSQPKLQYLDWQVVV